MRTSAAVIPVQRTRHHAVGRDPAGIASTACDALNHHVVPRLHVAMKTSGVMIHAAIAPFSICWQGVDHGTAHLPRSM